MIREWKLTDKETEQVTSRGGNVVEAQKAKKQAYLAAGGNMTEQCSREVYSGDSFFGHQCTKKVMVEREGKHYCKIHDPEYILGKNRKKQEEWEKAWAAKQVRRAEEKKDRELASAAIEACKKINPSNPMAVAKGMGEIVEALKKISKGEGRYSLDRLTHASNTIEDMQDVAIEALKSVDSPSVV